MAADGIHAACVDLKNPPLWVLPVASKIYDTIWEFAERDMRTPTMADFQYVTGESDYRVRTALQMLHDGELIKSHWESRLYRRFEIVKTGKMTRTRLSSIRKRKAA